MMTVSYALSFVVGYLSYLPEPFTYVRPVGAPAISGVLWYVCWRSRTQMPHEGDLGGNVSVAANLSSQRQNFSKTYVLALVFFLVSSIATGFINIGSVMYLPSGSTFVRDTLSLALSLILVGVIWISHRLVKTEFVLIAILGLVLFSGIFIATFIQRDLFTWGTGFMQASKSCFSLVLAMLVLLRIAAIPRSSGVVRLLALFVVPTLVSSFISYVVVPLVAEGFHISYGAFWGTMSLGMGFALGVFLFVLFSSFAIREFPDSPPMASGLEPSGKTSGGDAGIDAVEFIARERGLTAREREVLGFLIEGNTFKKIASLLGVSENTVQYHAKNIYRKLDIHTKQQLIDEVNRMRRSM